MGEAATLAGIYLRILAVRVRSDWQYRVSFVLFTISQGGITLLDFAAIAVILNRVPRLGGWSLTEIAFLYGTTGLSFGFADTFVSAVELSSQRIKAGNFDKLLIRPLGPLFQLTAEEFAFRRFGKMAQAAVVLVVACTRLPVHWTPGRVAMVLTMVAAGAAIFSALFVITSSLAFWTVDTQEFANAFTYGGNFLTQYPLGVFAGWLRRLALLLGLAFVNYLPATWVLGRDDTLGLPAATQFASPLVAIAAVLVARAVWHTAIRHYRSTGS